MTQTFTPTEEQLAIVDAARNTKDNLLIEALAGAAKTTTLELIAKKVIMPTLCLAFNKKIAEAMSERLPGHVACKTLNALGHATWASQLGKHIVIDSKKSHTFLSNEVKGLAKADQSEAWEDFADTLKMIGLAKQAGMIPNGIFQGVTPSTTEEDFYGSFDIEPTSLQKRLVNRALEHSIKGAYDGLCDFDDQIYMPTLFGGNFPRFPLVMVDEAQDLSALNHAMLKRLVTQRLIAVGDPNQSIYGFRGAVASGMSQLQQTFNMRALPLSISFRCPKEVIRRAQQTRTPHMRWPDWAIEGKVSSLPDWSASEIPDGSAIICRNNAPLFRCALQLLKYGRGVQMVGADIGPALIKILKKFSKDTKLAKHQVLEAIDAWEETNLKKSKSPGAIHDRADCLRVFAEAGNDLGGAIAYAESIFAMSGPIQLLSGHKSKGLEWDTVYHLDPFRVPSKYAREGEELEQEKNIQYVIETRPKKELYLVTLETLHG